MTTEIIQWRCHTPALLKEIIEYNQGTGIFFQPMKIFKGLLAQVAERASELDDPILNALMCRLTLYEIADPYSKEYDSKLVNKILKTAKKLKDENNNKPNRTRK